MLDLFILIIVIFVVYISTKMYFENRSTEVDYVISDVDHSEYLVRNLPDKKEAANLLSMVKERIVKLINYLKKKYPQDARINRLYERFNPNHISESSPDSKYTSYSVNKGEKIVFCIRQRDDKEQLKQNLDGFALVVHDCYCSFFYF